MWRSLVLLLCLLPLSWIASCGWQLQGYEKFKASGPQAIESIDLITTADNRLFQATLKQQLEDLSIRIDKQSDLNLTVHGENTEKRPLSYGSTGIPVQYQLIMTIRFAYSKDKTVAPTERSLVARRQYDFDTELLIAKYEEERNLLQEMRIELVNRILASIQD